MKHRRGDGRSRNTPDDRRLGRSADRRAAQPPVLLRIPHVGASSMPPAAVVQQPQLAWLSLAAAAPLLTLALWLGWEMAETAVDDSFLLLESPSVVAAESSRQERRSASDMPSGPFTTPPLAAAIAKGRRGDVEEIVELTETPTASAATDVAPPR